MCQQFEAGEARAHGWLHSEALRWFLLGTYAWQLGEETLKYLLGHKRPLRQSRMDAYRRVLRSRLRATVGHDGSVM